MTDYSSFGHADMEGSLRRARMQAEKIKDMQDELMSLVGRGEAADGKVRVEYATGVGMQNLEVDPRAMRMASQELCAAITSAVREAMGDLQRQTSALAKARLGDLGDTEKLRSQVVAAQREFDSKMSDVNEQLALATARLRRG
jgi:DNA-binding protein YbaB